jgi:hypothetical protein
MKNLEVEQIARFADMLAAMGTDRACGSSAAG